MTRTPDAVMLFAAGFGTRMGALTKDRPKPLIEVAGKPLIDHALDLTAHVSPSRVVANLHYKAEMLADHLAPRGVAVSIEEPDILETGGGLKAALPMLGDGPVFTMNTDAIWSGPNPLGLLLERWEPRDMDALLMCVPVGQAIGHTGQGDFSADPAGRAQRGGPLIYGGVQIVKTEGLAAIDKAVFSLNELWNIHAQSQRLFVTEYPGQWCDVGHPDGISLAETLLLEPDV
ncbi:nucleotidyltransferase family protein [Arenibacterium sp. CAU 1754]